MKKVRFYLNKELDKIMAEDFLNVRGDGIDFGAGITKIHPQLKFDKSMSCRQKKKTISIYFNNYYKDHKKTIHTKTQQAKKAWRKQEKEFVAITESFFDDFKFPKGKYIAYSSIINCGPRFLDSKTFQFFYKKTTDDAVYSIAHELLHFIFFDFVEKKLKKESKKLSEEQLWVLSEIFNIIVLKSQAYRHVINQQFVVPYPDHQQYLPEFEKAYKKSKNAKEFILQGISIMLEQKNSD